MKKLLIILALVSLPFSTIAQQWQWLYPYPTTNGVIDFYFTDKDNGFIIAKNGEILKTNDGCLTWESKTFDDITLIDIFSFNKDNTWILGRDYSVWSSQYYILKTNNGGNSWNQYDLPSSGGSYNCLYFLSENKGWIAGASGNLKMTTNGGVSWTDKSITGDNRPDIFFIHFADDLNGVVIGKNHGIIIGKTNNGGSSWDLNLAGVENYFYGGYFANPNTYYAVGERGLILNTNNYGTNWSFPSNTIQKSLYSLSFSNQTTGWAVGEDSTVLKTTNGGQSWEPQSLGFSSKFVEVKFVDSNIGWILGTQNGYQTNKTFLSTENGGQNWENKFVTFDENLNFTDVCFVDSANGWVISDKKIYRTKNGGRTWKLQYAAPSGYYSDYLYSIFFVDSLKGFCVGSKSSKGFILKTTDGGDNWTSQSYGFGPLRDLHFISESTGWFVGDDGTILRTLNGGSTFEYLTSGVTNSIYDIYFLDDNHGWAVTNAQTILRTNDGGINWSSSAFSTYHYYHGRCVFFSDTLTGFIGTTDGLFKSIDGGVNWSPISLTSYKDITDIYFANEKEGWASAGYSGWSSSGGIVYHTNDGGNIWNAVLNSSESLNSFSFIPEGYAWAVGGNSTIAKYKHGSPLTNTNFSNSIFGPTKYELYQSYPNPFNPTTTITYDLPVRTHVELKVYDTLGREIKTLVNEIKDAGRHQINLNLQNYASGTYFYQIKADNFVKTKKLSLVK